MKKEVKKIDYDLELKASLVLFAVSIVITVICVLLRWDGWMYQMEFYTKLYK